MLALMLDFAASSLSDRSKMAWSPSIVSVTRIVTGRPVVKSSSFWSTAW